MGGNSANFRAGAVIVAHGERGGAFSNAILLGHAGLVANVVSGVAVRAGVLSGEPTLEEALAAVAEQTDGPILIYPFFMAAGYFVNVKIPKRLADAGVGERCRVLAPLGTSEALPALIHAKALDTAAGAGVEASSARLLVVGHGSKVARASAEATDEVVLRLRELGGFAEVVTAFLEEAPFLDDVVMASDRATVVVGFFNGDGLHAAEDVPQALAAFTGPIAYTGPVGAFAEISALIEKTIAASVSEATGESAEF